MKYIKYLILGITFGIILTKAEVISWFRIYEMFRFQSFHMYGVIGTAVLVGAIGLLILKKRNFRDLKGNIINPPDKKMSITRYLVGGAIFGLGWALTGACPGPLFALLGSGFVVIAVAILAALAGTYVYGLVRTKLPH